MEPFGKYAKNHVRYPCTNESIPAVIAGLDLKKDDIVISIAGSGDMLFAIAPYVKKVYAVDHEGSQVEFVKEQIMALKRGNLELFYRKDLAGKIDGCWFDDMLKDSDVTLRDMLRREEYFSGDRLVDVLESLHKIEVYRDSIDFFIDKCPVFDKLYLSNANPGFFNEGISGLVNGGLIYASSCKYMWERRFPELGINHDKTEVAKKLEKELNSVWSWSPKVYEKVR